MRGRGGQYRAGAALVALAAAMSWAMAAGAADKASSDTDKSADGAVKDKSSDGNFEPFKPESKTSTGSVTVGGQAISYQAIAGTLIVHPKGWDDVLRDPKSEKEGSNEGEPRNPNAEASMFYVAYFKTGGGPRPVTFLFNGGPGSATLWLHMGAFGPRRVVTSTDAHTPAAPYSLVNNASSLLDVTDLVFIDAPGTGFSRISGKDKEKAFFGIDPDAYAFAEFISEFLSKYGRWNSPKYLFGESYGTPRSAVLINQLESERSIDFNGVILLSQILNFDLSPDRPTGNPGSICRIKPCSPPMQRLRGTTTSFPVSMPTFRRSSRRSKTSRWGTMAGRSRRDRTSPLRSAPQSPRSCTSTPGFPSTTS